MRRLRALVVGLPADAAVHRFDQSAPPATPQRRRRPSSVETIRKAGGKVIEIHRDKAG